MRKAVVYKYAPDGTASPAAPVRANEGKEAYRSAVLKPGEYVELWYSDSGMVKRRKYHNPEAVAEAGPSFNQGLKQLSEVAKADNSNALPAKEAAKPAAVIAPAAVEKPESADETPVDAEDIQEESAPVKETPSPEPKPKKKKA